MRSNGTYWSRFWRQRRSRRRILATGAAGGAGAISLALIGCGDDDDDDGNETPSPTATMDTATSPTVAASPTADGAPPQGGDVTFGIVASNQPLDPHTSLSRAVQFWPLFQSRLVDNDAVSIEPLAGALIADWEQADELTLVLHAREGALWHEGKRTDGRPFTAEDIQFNLERIIGKYDPERVALFHRRSYLAGLDRVEVVDETTARAVFATPNPGFLAGVSDWRNSPVAPETVEADPDFLDVANFSGAGPFVIDAWDNATGTGRYSANPAYWKAGQPYLEGVRQVDLPDSAGLLSAFLSGQVSMLDGSSPQNRDQVASSRPSAAIIDYPSPLWDYFRLNQSRPPFDNPAVRQAIFKAIDYAEVMDGSYGAGFWDYSGHLVSGFPGAPSPEDISQRSPWNPANKEQDRAEARQLMESAGYPEGGVSFGFMPTGSAGTYYEHAVRIQAQLQSVWPEIDIELVVPGSGADFQRDLTGGNFDSVTYTSGSPPSLPAEMESHYRTGGSRNYTQFSDPDLDRVIQDLVVEFDTEARNALYADLDSLLDEKVWSLTLGRRRSVALIQEEVQGFPGGGLGTFTGGLDQPFFVDQYYISG